MFGKFKTLFILSLLATIGTQAQIAEENTATSQVKLPPQQTLFHYDFEDDGTENYVLSSIQGQNSWTVIGAGFYGTNVVSGLASHGIQNLRIGKDADLPINAIIGARSPDLTPAPPVPVFKAPVTGETMVKADILISALNLTDYSFVGYSPATGESAWQVIFNYDGTITVVDDRHGDGNPVFYNIFVHWPVNEYFTIKVTTSINDDEIRYYLNGTLFYKSINGIYAADNIGQIFFFGNNLPTDTEYALFDNLTIDTAVDDLIFMNGFE